MVIQKIRLISDFFDLEYAAACHLNTEMAVLGFGSVTELEYYIYIIYFLHLDSGDAAVL